MSDDALIRVKRLEKHFPIRKGLFKALSGEAVHAVNGIDFEIRRGETLGLVGESGCGKSTTARLLVSLMRPSAGAIYFDGVDLASLSPSALRAARRDFQIVFQDPFGSLDPRMTLRQLIEEPLRVATGQSADERLHRVHELLERVGLSSAHANRHPHEFSGGQRQRIGIARALALKPKFVVCDEPVSALDVSIQAQIVNLLKELQRDLGLTYLFVSHDLAVVSQISNRVAVMYLGKIVEIAETEKLFSEPRHPYTKALFNAMPIADPARVRDRPILGGELPSPIHLPAGCPFHPRCPVAIDRCRRDAPQLSRVGAGHAAACLLVGNDAAQMAHEGSA